MEKSGQACNVQGVMKGEEKRGENPQVTSTSEIIIFHNVMFPVVLIPNCNLFQHDFIFPVHNVCCESDPDPAPLLNTGRTSVQTQPRKINTGFDSDIKDNDRWKGGEGKKKKREKEKERKERSLEK